jgi:hypothetical protein
MAVPKVGAPILVQELFNVVDWTPTWTNVTPGTGNSNAGWYELIGDKVYFGGRLQLGTTPSFSGIVEVSTPVSMWVGGGNQLQMCEGSWIFRDASASDHYAGALGIWSSAGTELSFSGAWNGTAPSKRITTAVPVTCAVDDVLSFSGFGRIA